MEGDREGRKGTEDEGGGELRSYKEERFYINRSTVPGM